MGVRGVTWEDIKWLSKLEAFTKGYGTGRERSSSKACRYNWVGKGREIK